MNTLPQFYAQLLPFDIAVHGTLQFAEIAPEFGFAATADIIALQVSEVAQAVRHYPIVFLPGEGAAPPSLAALVGLGDGLNRFVDSQGRWREQTYIPAYVRRYPFMPMLIAGQTDPVLAIDMTQSWIQGQAGEPFADSAGQATARLQRVMVFQQEYQRQATITQTMCAAINDAGILEPRTLTWQDPSGQTRQLDGFWCVEESKLKVISHEVLHTLHHADALGLAYAQMMSMGNLQSLIAAAVTLPNQAQKTVRKRKTAGSAR